MRIIVGIIIGCVIGVMVGTQVIAPRLASQDLASSQGLATTEPTPVETLGPILPPAGPREPAIRWRMASAYSASLPQLGTLAKRVSRQAWEVSDGDIELSFFEPGNLVPTPQMFDAVASGTIDAAFSSPGFWSEKEPALQLFSTIPFGPSPGEYLAWVYFGGGQELMNEIYHAHGIHSLPCGMIAPEAAGWYRRAFTDPGDLKGLTIRASGLGARVMEKVGMLPHALDDADIFLALENGTIDAVEFSMPAIDLKLGLHQLASHYYFPGWHQPASFFELMINKDKWDNLTSTRKSQIKAVCGDNVRHGLAEGEALQYQALKELTAKGVKILRWPTSILSAFEAAWKDVAAEQSTADTKFRRVWKSLSNFRKHYAVWQELAQP